MKSYRIWLSIAAILFIGKMFGTVWTQAEDLGGFDVSVSEGENWSLPDNWQENTSGWEEEADTKSTAESENESFAQGNKVENFVGESEDIFSSTAESIQQNNQQQNNLQNSNDQDINDRGNNNQDINDRGNNNQDINDRGNNNQESNDQESNYQESNDQESNYQNSNNQENNNRSSNNQNNKMNNNNQNNNQNSTKQRSNRQENDGQDSVQPAHKQQSLIQRLSGLSEEKSGEPKIPESKETGKIVEGELEPKVYVSQEERQKAKEQDRAVNFRRTKDMTFFHKKQAGKKDILYLTVTRLNIHQILSVRLNGKECRWNREGSRIVLEDRPEQGKNKVEVRFFLEDGLVRGMAPWIFTCD